MRDTSGTMEDILSEDTMMDCAGEIGSLDELVDLTTNIVESTPSIRDAAETLLTLLGADAENGELLSSGDEDGGHEEEDEEDEGVEVDVDETEGDRESRESARLLHELAASLAQELKYQHRSPAKVPQRFDGSPCQSMELTQETISCYKLRNRISTKTHCPPRAASTEPKYRENIFSQDRLPSFRSFTKGCYGVAVPSFVNRELNIRERLPRGQQDHQALPGAWLAGWDACTMEALRYLLEDEGLPPHHPTVVAMKNHLDVQRERAFAHRRTA